MMRAHLLTTYRRIVEATEPLMLPAIKRRDRREPGWDEKEENEERLARLVHRLFRQQSERVRSRLELHYPGEMKAIRTPIDIDLFDGDFEDEDILAELMKLLTDAAKGGIALFGQKTPLQIDWSLPNLRAAKWARDYAGDLLKELNNTSRRILKEVIGLFVETPGMTIGDVMSYLPFTEERARQVAVTEITRSYAEANQIAGQELAKEFPDVRVIKVWFTNNDDRVCDICAPLDGTEVEILDGFGVESGEEGLMNPPAHINCRCWTETTTALAELD